MKDFVSIVGVSHLPIGQSKRSLVSYHVRNKTLIGIRVVADNAILIFSDSHSFCLQKSPARIQPPEVYLLFKPLTKASSSLSSPEPKQRSSNLQSPVAELTNLLC